MGKKEGQVKNAVGIGKRLGYTSRTNRVYILYQDSLLAVGLHSMLAARGRVVVGIDLKETGAWDHLQRALQPGDVVIVDKRDKEVHPALSIMQLFMNCHEISVIELDSSESKMELYQRQRRAVENPEQLSGLIDQCQVQLARRKQKGG